LFDKSKPQQTICFTKGKAQIATRAKIVSNNCYGYVLSGVTHIDSFGESMPKKVYAGNWFSVGGNTNNDSRVSVQGGQVLLIEWGECGLRQKPFACGEPTQDGILGYIDGAENSLLYGPLKMGEACINCLHIVGKIDQTAHTHPSPRIGVVLNGGIDVKIWDSQGDGTKVIEEHHLNSGDVWAMDKDVIHSFHSNKNIQARILAFHPDSDFGPTDEVAPMINRTMVNGQSASLITEIHTAKK
jgi:hypothetical protein